MYNVLRTIFFNLLLYILQKVHTMMRPKRNSVQSTYDGQGERKRALSGDSFLGRGTVGEGNIK